MVFIQIQSECRELKHQQQREYKYAMMAKRNILAINHEYPAKKNQIIRWERLANNRLSQRWICQIMNWSRTSFWTETINRDRRRSSTYSILFGEKRVETGVVSFHSSFSIYFFKVRNERSPLYCRKTPSRTLDRQYFKAKQQQNRPYW